jgi:hypothetical protein
MNARKAFNPCRGLLSYTLQKRRHCVIFAAHHSNSPNVKQDNVRDISRRKG